jgi:hypothetical protein
LEEEKEEQRRKLCCKALVNVSIQYVSYSVSGWVNDDDDDDDEGEEKFSK